MWVGADKQALELRSSPYLSVFPREAVYSLTFAGSRLDPIPLVHGLVELGRTCD